MIRLSRRSTRNGDSGRISQDARDTSMPCSVPSNVALPVSAWSTPCALISISLYRCRRACGMNGNTRMATDGSELRLASVRSVRDSRYSAKIAKPKSVPVAASARAHTAAMVAIRGLRIRIFWRIAA
ncbi:Uncharacterised protein [Mycobacteroides abscessus subsp. abscessus]|nr:Uncharacterised protein [Mycobacteroides abscessus subsp. abscessus]